MSASSVTLQWLFLFVAVLSGGSFAVAQTQAPRDFGAETVLGPDSREIHSLPPELVEDQGAPALSSQGTTVAKKRNDAAADVAAEKPSAEESTDEPDQAEDLPTGALPEESKEGAFKAGTTSALNVNDVEITTLIKTFSKITGRNYIIDNAVKGKITIHQPTRVSIDEALRILETVLLLKGFTTVPVEKNTYKVVPAKEARQTTIPLVLDSEKSTSDALVTQLIRLKYVQADELKQTLTPFISKDGLVDAFAGTNSLIIIDSASNIERLAKIIKQIDVPAIDQDITIIPVEHAEAKDVADKILEILGEKEGEGGTRNQVRTPRPAGVTNTPQPGMAVPVQANTQSRTGQRRLPAKVIPDERTNSLIVVADPEMTSRVRALVEQLDSSVDRSGGRFYVYRLKHADAEELAGILSALISGSTYEGSSQKKETGSSLSRSSRENSNSSSSSGTNRYGSSSRSSSTFSGARGQLRPNVGTGDNTKVAFEGEVSIAPDPSTNSLIVNASRADYAKLKEVIDVLDVKRRQVIVEATILEITLDGLQGMGVELQGTLGYDDGAILAQSNFGALSNILSNPQALSDLSIAAASSGTITLPGGITIPSQAVLISAVSRNTNVNVLSSPTILTTDNQEAEIIVGQNVPFLTGTSSDTTNLNNTFNQIERQDVGITLRITPQISTGDFVTLRIFVEISDVVTGTQRDPNGPTTTIRTAETTVEVKSDQMVVTGGLLSDAVTNATRGVPFFEDIPVLGNLFKRQDEIHRRTNLLVFLTPKIITDQFDARDTALERRDVMQKEIGQPENESLERRGVLESDKLDNVAEDLPPPAIPPSTITGASALAPKGEKEKAAMARLKKRFEAIGAAPEELTEHPPAPPRVETKGDELNITVTPKLPTSGGTEAPKERAVASQVATQERQPDTGEKTYAVLRVLKGKEALSSQFPSADDRGTIGLVVSAPPGSSHGRFFEAGGRYTFETPQGRVTLVCLGRYASLSEASTVHSQLSDASKWYALSPQEVLTLGRGVWTKG